MTTGPLELERRVHQLDNDVRDIYTLLAQIQLTQGRHSNRFDEMGADLDGLRLKVDALDTKVDTVLELLRSGPTTA